jgi:hypothetical protein
VAAIGVGTLFIGLFLCYASYKAIHNHVTAAPLSSAKAALP